MRLRTAAGLTPRNLCRLGRQGFDPRRPKLTYGEVVKRALKHLISVQDASGRLGREVDRYIYNQPAGHARLVRGLRKSPGSGSSMAARRRSAPSSTRGTGRRLALRIRSADTDSSVTGWAVIAIKSAETAGLTVDRTVCDGAAGGSTRSRSRPRSPQRRGLPRWDEGGSSPCRLSRSEGCGEAGSASRSANEHYGYTPAMTAIMMLATILMSGKLPSKAEGCWTLFSPFPGQWTMEDKALLAQGRLLLLVHATYALSRVDERG